jgi:hypothetical protein
VRYEWRGGLPDTFPILTAQQFEALWADLIAEFAIEDAVESGASVKREKLQDAIHTDPVAQRLIDKGMVKKIDRTGALHIDCPFEGGHSTESAESSTTYFPAHTGGYANGHFHCLHASCQGREDHEFKTAIGYVDEDVLADFENLCAPAEQAAHQLPEEAGIAEAASTEDQDHASAVGADAAASGGVAGGVKLKFAVIPANEFADRPAPQWIVKGVIPRAELVVLFGESGSGKSFVALDLGAAIAQGIPWRGRKVKQGRIAYIAAEGSGGFRNRLKAYQQVTNTDLSDFAFGVIPAAPNLLEKAEAIEVAKAVIAWGRADLIIIDTLAQTMPGGNENGGEDMGKILAHCKGIYRATGATVMLIHHSGKDATKGARGWSGLRAAADAEIEVQKGEGTRLIRVSKQKDGDDSLEWGFNLDIVQIGVDEDGEAVTSCAVMEAEIQAKSTRRKLGAVEKIVAEVVGEIGLAQTEGIEIKAVIYEAARRMAPPTEGKRDTRKQHARRALLALCTGDDAPYMVEDDCLAIL